MNVNLRNCAKVFLASLLCSVATANAESTVSVGDGQLKASARINIKIVIPEVLATDVKRQIVTEKTGPIVRTFTVEPVNTMLAADTQQDGFLLASFDGAQLFRPVELGMAVTVSKP
jgi:hypothetical protein